MLAWIVYFRESAIKNKRYIQFYVEEGAKLGIKIKLVMVEDLEFGVRDNTWFLIHKKDPTDRPDFVISRAIYPLLSRQFELMGIKVYNNSLVAELCNDKAKTYQYLAKTGIRMIDSSFYRNSQVNHVLSEVETLTVIKAVEGHGGKQVFLVEPSEVRIYDIASESEDDMENTGSFHHKNEIMNGLANSDVVVQPFTGTRNLDLRVFVIGKEIVAALVRTFKENSQSRLSLSGEVSKYLLTEEEKAIVKVIIDQFDFGLVGVDFLIGKDGELIFKGIEDVAGCRTIYECTDINIVGQYLEYMRSNVRQSGTLIR